MAIHTAWEYIEAVKENGRLKEQIGLLIVQLATIQSEHDRAVSEFNRMLYEKNLMRDEAVREKARADALQVELTVIEKVISEPHYGVSR